MARPGWLKNGMAQANFQSKISSYYDFGLYTCPCGKKKASRSCL